MSELVMTQKPNTRLEDYCEIYRIPKEMIPVLNNLKKSEHYLFQNRKVVEESGERYITLCTGYYTGVGMNSKRVDLTPIIRDAVRRAGLRYKAYNMAPKGGVAGERINIYF
jgi:hypothetical protein